MKRKPFGRTGVGVSSIGLGTRGFGVHVDEETARQLVERSLDAGISLFDTAAAYGDGAAEEILGRLLAPVREHVLIASRMGGPVELGLPRRVSSRLHLHRAVELSLRRLQTDRIDILFVELGFGGAWLEETLRAVDDLVRSGKVVYSGATNSPAWQTMQALGESRARGCAEFVAVQPMYSLIKRQAEVELLPMALASGLGVLTYSPLAGGLLGGAYSQAESPPRGLLARDPVYAARYGAAGDLATAERFVSTALDWGYHPAALAIAWAGSHPGVTAPVIGPSDVDQLEVALAAERIALTPAMRAELSLLSTRPAPAHDRSEEDVVEATRA
jgi:aryl-alcohol dehydrogenase-like predicted oxidoreductase